ncbi:MAG: hypothetical protein EAX96_03755 [Candidatus Lokiarchaeota archaeon]|nr:hypothetical protein [Candidatus Lokiarchaeota archaeon]
MAKTTKKEIVIDLRKIPDPNFLDILKNKLNFLDVSVKMSKPGQVSILLKGLRERINYGESIIKNLIIEYKKEN